MYKAGLQVNLIAVREIAHDIRLLEFGPSDQGSLPPAEPGAHIDLYLPNGLLRQYSLLDSSDAPKSYSVAVKRDPKGRGGSDFIFNHLRPGQRLTIGAPRNCFPLVEDAAHVVLSAGGIGITAILPMFKRLVALKKSVELHYAGRSRDSMPFLTVLEPHANVSIHCDDERDGRVLDIGRIAAICPVGSHLYCCGPNPMITAFLEATADRPRDRIHVEYFTPMRESSSEGEYVVQLARSGREFLIPSGKSILHVLLEAGIEVPAYWCEQGICRGCEVSVISGIPDHRDSIMTVEEHASNRSMTICCSGAKTDTLVLDL
ncbi:PDR/VanB family oxidoreductase [Bradyrhizobium betae]|uniref:Oxidoreductase n=1 Tax=Bradyrhizobium betae TaxID=244734 RepID=A0A4V1P8D7_9BRAD|nr:PDR/VanB family oxidoreductase [Bradyrhizobium betae]RXT54259.1 hypothetical protein B5V03_02125 [Bradyrhizobium betae]